MTTNAIHIQDPFLSERYLKTFEEVVRTKALLKPLTIDFSANTSLDGDFIEALNQYASRLKNESIPYVILCSTDLAGSLKDSEFFKGAMSVVNFRPNRLDSSQELFKDDFSLPKVVFDAFNITLEEYLGLATSAQMPVYTSPFAGKEMDIAAQVLLKINQRQIRIIARYDQAFIKNFNGKLLGEEVSEITDEHLTWAAEILNSVANHSKRCLFNANHEVKMFQPELINENSHTPHGLPISSFELISDLGKCFVDLFIEPLDM